MKGGTASAAVGSTNIEERVRGAHHAAKLVESYQLRQAQYKNEEADFADLDSAVNMKSMTKEEAQKLKARGLMHDKTRSGGNSKFEAAVAGADFQSTQAVLEKHLEVEYGCLAKCLRFDKISRAANFESKRRAAPGYRHIVPGLDRFVHSNPFEMFIGFIMITNGLLIGVQTSSSGTDTDTALNDILEQVFTIIFSLEIFLRVFAEGWPWLWNVTNLADTLLIIITGVVPLWVFKPLNIESPLLRSMSVLRVLRLVRLIRLVRTVPIFRILWGLVRGLLGCGRLLLFTYVIIFIVLFMFAVFSVYLIGRIDVFRDDKSVQFHFGKVPTAVITFFQIMTLDSWTALLRPMQQVEPIAGILVIVFIMVCNLVLLNLVTAVICNNAFEQAELDEELKALEKREAMTKDTADLRVIFLDIDTDGSGALSRSEYFEAVNTDERVVAKFQRLEIGENETEEIWELLERNGEIQVDDFINSLLAMQGDARAKDSFTMVKNITKVNKKIEKITTMVKAHKAMADRLHKEVGIVEQELAKMLKELVEFTALIGQCIPEIAAPRQREHLTNTKWEVNRKVKLLS